MNSRSAQGGGVSRHLASLLILAGGQSRRFGTDKSLLTVDGKLLVQVLHERLGDLFDKTVIASNRPGKFSIPGVVETADRYEGRGPLGGMQAGLSLVDTPWALVLACDMPAVDRETVGRLLAAAEGTDADAVIPRHAEGYEPLCGMYRRDLLDAVNRLLLVNDHRPGLLELLRSAKVEYLPVDNCFFNINTPGDADRIRWQTQNAAPGRKTRYKDFFQRETC